MDIELDQLNDDTRQLVHEMADAMRRAVIEHMRKTGSSLTLDDIQIAGMLASTKAAEDIRKRVAAKNQGVAV